MTVYVEDGCFFRGTHTHLYDLITSEPPPKVSGVVNLYTQECFQEIHEHLASDARHLLAAGPPAATARHAGR